MEAPSRSSPERGGAGYCSGPVCAPAASGSPAPRRGNGAAEWEGAVSRVSEEEGTPGCLGTHPLAPDCCFCLPTFLLRKSLSIGAEEHCHHNALAPELVGLTSLPFPTMIRSRENNALRPGPFCQMQCAKAQNTCVALPSDPEG